VPAVLGLSAGDRLLIVLGAPALGLAAGYLLPRGAEWAVSSLSWVPMRGPLELIASFDGSWALIAFLVAGVVLGLGVAYAAIVESLRVTVTGSEIRLDRDEKSRTIARADVDLVFLDGKALVVLDGESRQLARERHEATADKVERIFRAYGYPWLDVDPYAQLWRRWVPNTPDLPGSVNAVLAAREVALREKAAKDVAELGDEVQRQGFAIRDDGTRQYWRPLVRS
jgi:hypothetical protein